MAKPTGKSYRDLNIEIRNTISRNFWTTVDLFSMLNGPGRTLTITTAIQDLITTPEWLDWQNDGIREVLREHLQN